MSSAYRHKTDRRNGKHKPQDAPARYTPGFSRNLDRRTEVYKRLAARFESLLADLGGTDNLSEMKLSLLERFVWLEDSLEKLEQAMTTADDPRLVADLSGRWTQAINSMQGIAKMLGLETATGTLPWSMSNGDLEFK